MFSMLPTHAYTYSQSQYYTPNHPSPLSSSPLRNSPSPLSARDTNVSPRRAQDTVMSSPSKPGYSPSNPKSIFTSPSTTPGTSSRTPLISPPPTKRHSAYSRRTTKANPLMSGLTGDDGRETRRKLFLKRVREGGEEKRWRERGGDEEIMRCLWVAENRRRDEKKQREAMGITEPPEEDEEERMVNLDEVMVEEVAMSEELELEALLGNLNPEDQDISHGDAPSNEMDMLSGESTNDRVHTQASHYQQSIYGSDDDEYDNIFMDVIQEESRISSQQPSGSINDQEMMDLS
ncbi:hypothetical protein LZ554_007515 [Drepanopeziza brunnea f. sp. 'monogermtubi']|nr:hypothetical protein LZ554_007515 [Drepanopeziza brunnea f. sp. 'monogermtubi']